MERSKPPLHTSQKGILQFPSGQQSLEMTNALKKTDVTDGGGGVKEAENKVNSFATEG